MLLAWMSAWAVLSALFTTGVYASCPTDQGIPVVTMCTDSSTTGMDVYIDTDTASATVNEAGAAVCKCSIIVYSGKLVNVNLPVTPSLNCGTSLQFRNESGDQLHQAACNSSLQHDINIPGPPATIDMSLVKESSPYESNYCVRLTLVSCNSTTEFQCDDGTQCITAGSKCDNIPDCGDFSDESQKNCLLAGTCSEGRLKCMTTSQCYLPSQTCDNVTDCSDGSDERNCDSNGISTVPPTSTTPLDNTPRIKVMCYESGKFTTTTTTTPEPTTTTPEPTTTTLEPTTTTPELTTSEPTTTTPEPTTTTPEPTTTTPELTTTPEPTKITPEPTTAMPEPTMTTQEQTTTTPEPNTTTTKPTTPTTKPTSPIPEPTTTTLEPASSTPEPTTITTTAQETITEQITNTTIEQETATAPNSTTTTESSTTTMTKTSSSTKEPTTSTAVPSTTQKNDTTMKPDEKGLDDTTVKIIVVCVVVGVLIIILTIAAICMLTIRKHNYWSPDKQQQENVWITSDDVITKDNIDNTKDQNIVEAQSRL